MESLGAEAKRGLLWSLMDASSPPSESLPNLWQERSRCVYRTRNKKRHILASDPVHTLRYDGGSTFERLG